MTTTHGARRANWFGALLASAVFAACAVGIYYLSADARREINALATANADSTQWALAQSEVELLALLSESLRSDLPQEDQVANVRRRFDVFYSRVSTMQESAVLADLRQDDDVRAILSDVSGRLDSMIPIIDGPDADLIAALPEITGQIDAIRPAVRDVSLIGVEYFSRIADAQRARVANALLRLGLLTFLLVAALSATVLALIKSFRNATRDALEKAEAQKRMAVIVSTSLDAIIAVDLDGRVIEFNEAAERTFGYSRDEIIGHKMSDKIVPDKLHAAHEAGMKRYIDTRERRVVGQGRVQLEAKHKSGRIFPVELSISSAEGPDGEIFVSYLRDISNRVAKEEELVKARDEAVAGERAKADLVAVMSHEMRTPLNGIVGALELMKTTDLDKTQSNMTDVMSTSAEMLLQHVNAVLDMSRLEAGAAETIKRPFDPAAVAKELLTSLKMSAQDHGNVLKLDVVDPDFTLVLGDPGKFRQILTNLVSNAIKFTSHGTITVEIEPHLAEEQWELRVTDDGIGISEEDQARVFDDFVTLDPSYTRAQEGTGLGLAIVRRLVEHLGGEIGIESEKGAGSVFWVRLPTNIASEASKPLDHAHVSPISVHIDHARPELSILLVEDNAINRVVAREMLAKLGHSCVEAYNGAEAVKLAEMKLFDAILMDISMPDMDGVEATRQIKASAGPNAKTPIFAVTAHAMPADVDRFRAAGMVDVLVKPIGLNRLNGLLNRSAIQGDATPYWDKTHQRDLKDAIGEDKWRELMKLFVEEMDAACNATFARGGMTDMEGLRSEVHKLAGSAFTLGASRLGQLLRRIEEELDASDEHVARDLIGLVPGCWSKTNSDQMLDTRPD
ncbi:MAG: PAS domain S-box protein [Octadecabacter sp.]|nr:PAS domain S-box protein [Octadecabacter sp.]